MRSVAVEGTNNFRDKLLAFRRRSDFPLARAPRSDLRAADLDQQHQPAAERARGRQQHLHRRRGHSAACAADRLPGRRSGAAVRLHTRRRARELRHREAGRRALFPVELLEQLRHDVRTGRTRRRRPTTTGIWASTSRGSSSDASCVPRYSRLVSGVGWQLPASFRAAAAVALRLEVRPSSPRQRAPRARAAPRSRSPRMA